MSAKRPKNKYSWDKIVKTPEQSRVPDNWRIGTLRYDAGTRTASNSNKRTHSQSY